MRHRLLFSIIAVALATSAFAERVTPTVRMYGSRVDVDGGTSTRFATTVALSDTGDESVALAQTTLSSGTMRGVVVTIADADNSSACAIAVVGKNSDGVTVSEAIATDGAGTYYGGTFYTTITSVETTCTGTGADTVSLGEGAQWMQASLPPSCVGWMWCRATESTSDIILNLNNTPATTVGDDADANYTNQLVLTADRPCREISGFNPAASYFSALSDVADTGAALLITEAICY